MRAPTAAHHSRVVRRRLQLRLRRGPQTACKRGHTPSCGVRLCHVWRPPDLATTSLRLLNSGKAAVRTPLRRFCAASVVPPPLRRRCRPPPPAFVCILLPRVVISPLLRNLLGAGSPRTHAIVRAWPLPPSPLLSRAAPSPIPLPPPPCSSSPLFKIFFFTPLLFRHHGHGQHCLSCWLCRCRPPLAAIRAHPPRQPDLVGRRPGGGRGGYRRRRHPRRVLGVRQPPPRVACGRRWLWVPPPPHVPGDSGVVCVAGRPEAAPLLL